MHLTCPLGHRRLAYGHQGRIGMPVAALAAWRRLLVCSARQRCPPLGYLRMRSMSTARTAAFASQRRERGAAGLGERPPSTPTLQRTNPAAPSGQAAASADRKRSQQTGGLAVALLTPIKWMGGGEYAGLTRTQVSEMEGFQCFTIVADAVILSAAERAPVPWCPLGQPRQMS